MKNNRTVMKSYYSLIYFFAIVLLVSCAEDLPDNTVDMSLGNYETGVFFINEGPFGSGTGTIDHYDREEEVLTRGIYQEVNNLPIGNILQSMNVVGDRAYLAVNNSNKIEIVNINTFENLGTITELRQPRYAIETGDDKLLVTEWGDDGVSGQIARVDLITNEVLNRVPWNGPEQIITQGSRTYILDNGGFGEGSSVSILNDNYEKVGEISVGQKPESAVIDRNGDIWVLSSGSFITLGGARLDRISDETSVSNEDLAFGASSLTINNDGDQLYYFAQGDIMTRSISSTTSSVFYDLDDTDIPYGLGVDPVTGHLYIGTTPDYSSESTTYIVDADGNLLRTLTSGVLTNSFFFR